MIYNYTTDLTLLRYPAEAGGEQTPQIDQRLRLSNLKDDRILDNSPYRGYTAYMVISGRIHNGVVTLQDGISLPEGMEVTVVAPITHQSIGGQITEEQRRALQNARREIESLPNENPRDAFSGADHDLVLYGNE